MLLSVNRRLLAAALILLPACAMPVCAHHRVIPGHPLGHPVIGLALAIGRAIGASVEGWLLERAFRDMLRSDAADLLERKGLARG